MKIKVNQNDIFDYIVGNSNYDPIEKCIDPLRYEVFDTSIYDSKRKEYLGQSEEYKSFCKQVSQARKTFVQKDVSGRSRSEIVRLCCELEEIAPTEINLTEILTYE